MPTAADIYYSAHEPDDQTRPPVILIHGAGGSHLDWPAQIRRLEGVRVYAIDLPAHGKSEGIACQFIDEYAERVNQFTRALKLSMFILGGHSMGGAIALALALRFPKRVQGLALLGCGPRFRVPSELLELSSNPATFQTAIQKLVERSYGMKVDSRLKELGAQSLSEVRPTVLHGDLLACDDFDVSERLTKISVPTQIIAGTDDRMTPLRQAEYLRDHLPAARLHTLVGVGHMSMLEQPVQVTQILSAFVREIT